MVQKGIKMDIIKKIAEELQIRPDQVQAVVNLIDEGNTIPFIARYRKEAHGALNDEILRNLDERLTYLRNLEEKKSSVLASMEELGVLTDDLKKKMEQAQTLAVIEDLYRPYRPKRRTRATIAKEKGLEPLANEILLGQAKGTKEELAKAFVSPEKGVESTEDAILGAMDILAEHISDDASFRAQIRKMTWEKGMLTSTVREEGTESVFETYYEFQAQLTKINGHQVLAVNRGENQKVLSVKIEAPQEEILSWLYNVMTKGKNETCAAILREATEDAYKRLIAPAIERELRTNLTETAEEGAMKVFGQNLKQLLMQPPIAGQTVLGWDPAFRTGCKLAVIDPFGKVIDTKVIYPTAPHNKVKESKDILKALIAKYHITLISVGNGTASRESEQIIADLIKEINAPVRYVITNEAGASVYSASKQATEEFPNFDVGQRSAVSIARRVQDPLAELVKIDPKAIGVGQYQHDMNQKKLDEMLHGTVEDCVNQVGVDLNTASAALLEYVSGITKTIAKNPTAKHNYTILDTMEAGIVLTGTEIKSIRNGKVNLKDSYAGIKNGEVYIYSMHISPYEHGNIFNKNPLRDRKLLLNKREIFKLEGMISKKGYTLVPISLYFKKNRVKVELGIGKGKKLFDKREDLKKKDSEMYIKKHLDI